MTRFIELRKSWRCWFWSGVAGLGLMSIGAFAAGPVASGLSAITFRGDSYTVRTIDPHKEDLRLYWKDDQGQLLHDFNSLEKFTKANGEHLIFATNAGMFTPDSKPVGLFVENGVEQIPLNLQEGDGNFYLKPNGIFLINAKHEAMAIESSTYPTLLSPVV